VRDGVVLGDALAKERPADALGMQKVVLRVDDEKGGSIEIELKALLGSTGLAGSA
jgi:hypothetical protein